MHLQIARQHVEEQNSPSLSNYSMTSIALKSRGFGPKMEIESAGGRTAHNHYVYGLMQYTLYPLSPQCVGSRSSESTGWLTQNRVRVLISSARHWCLGRFKKTVQFQVRTMYKMNCTSGCRLRTLFVFKNILNEDIILNE